MIHAMVGFLLLCACIWAAVRFWKPLLIIAGVLVALAGAVAAFEIINLDPAHPPVWWGSGPQREEAAKHAAWVADCEETTDDAAFLRYIGACPREVLARHPKRFDYPKTSPVINKAAR